jgi:RNA polymerase sigma-70 factor (ECF subfamily)
MTSVLARPLPPPASTRAERRAALDAPAGSRTEPLRVMFDEHAPALLAFAEHFTTHESAQDAVQETFLRAWRNLPRLRADPRALRPWLTVVLRRVLIDAHRADRAQPISVAEDAVFDHAVEDGSDRLLERWRLEHALAGLSPSHRQVLVEIYYRDTTSEMLAVNLGIARGTVRSRLHYALRALRHQLTDADETPPGRSGPAPVRSGTSALPAHCENRWPESGVAS